MSDGAPGLVPGSAEADERDLVRRGYDAVSYRCRADDAGDGLEVVSQEFIPEGGSGHALFWARRPAAGG